MISLQSIGIHTPSALTWLIAEGYLPDNPPPSSYVWRTYPDSESLEAGTMEEVLITEYCVVWSQGGLIRKAYNFSLEQQPISQALLAWFPMPRSDKHGESNDSPFSPLTSGVDSSKFNSDNAYESGRARALVVFLKLQAHVYFLSGSSHVINLPFEVKKAFPLQIGLLLQRKVSVEVQASSPRLPVAPPNSFFASFVQVAPHITAGNPSAIKGFEANKWDFDIARLRASPQVNTDHIPRHFVLMDALADMGLVLQSLTSNTDTPLHEAKDNRSLQLMGDDEDVVYVSRFDGPRSAAARSPDHLAVVASVSKSRAVFSLWHGVYTHPQPLTEASFTEETKAANGKPRRRSSFLHIGTTPSGQTLHQKARESFGALKPENSTLTIQGSQRKDGGKTVEESLVLQLDPDSNIQGVGHEARRVGSLLSRAELSASFDRFAYQDLSTSQGSHNVLTSSQIRRGRSVLTGSERASGSFKIRQTARNSTGQSVPRLEGNKSDGLSEPLIAGAQQVNRLIEGFSGQQSDVANLSKSSTKLSYQHKATESGKRDLLVQSFGEIPLGDFPWHSQLDNLTWPNEESESIRVFHLRLAPIDMGVNTAEQFLLCIINSTFHFLTLVRITTRKQPEDTVRARKTARSNMGPKAFSAMSKLIIDDISHHAGVMDAHKIVDGHEERLVLMRRAANGNVTYQVASPQLLESPIDLSIGRLRIFSPVTSSLAISEQSRREIGAKRTLLPQRLTRLANSDSNGTFDFVDADKIHHKVLLRLKSQLQPVADVLALCRLVLPSWLSSWVVNTWWEKSHDSPSLCDKEWRSLLLAFVILKSACDDRTDDGTDWSVRPTPSSPSQLPSTSRTSRENRLAGRAMWNVQSATISDRSYVSHAWSWVPRLVHDGNKKAQNLRTNPICGSSSCFRCFLLESRSAVESTSQGARIRFLQNRKDEIEPSLNRLRIALRLYSEEQELITMHASLPTLSERLNWLIRILGGASLFHAQRPSRKSSAMYEERAMELYSESACTPIFDRFHAPSGSATHPPSIIHWMKKTIANNFAAADFYISWLSEYSRNASELEAYLQVMHVIARLMPRVTAVMQIFNFLGSTRCNAKDILEQMSELRTGLKVSETFTTPLLVILQEVIASCREDPPATWSTALLRLVSRLDLISIEAEPQKDYDRKGAQAMYSIRDFHNICHSSDAADGPTVFAESERIAISRLIFGEDRRLIEALRMIEPVRVATAECIPDPSWDEAQLLEAQKEVVQLVMTRTFALAPGLGMAHFSSRIPLLTEKYIIHGYSTMCVVKPSNNTVMADRSTFTEERYGWAWFHAGVAAGLAISRQAKGIDTSWIMFNKPAEPNNRHAGLLLALGLNGHLRNIARWLAFKYLSPKHTMTSIGLLLGLSASHLGTMDALVTRLLSVHITRMLPPGAAELNLSPLAQATGLMGIGLLYCGTQHRRMSEVMLSEIESLEAETLTGSHDRLRDESYRLAAGFALGYINLGQGGDLGGLRDMQLVERLLSSAAGPKPVNLVHVLEQASAGATIAIALIFMKTGNMAVARKIDVPDTTPQFAFIRPDILLLRTLAKNIILWNGIEAKLDWVTNNLPKEYRRKYVLHEITSLSSEQLPFFHILSGLLWSISLKYSGSCNLKVRDFLLGYLDQFIRLCRLPAVRYDAKLTRNAVRNCQDLLALSSATVMAGSGDLLVMRRLRRLHGRINIDTTYGSHLASHMALGALFLGGGTFTFGTSNLAIASLICAFYPLFPTDVTDNKAHLQAFRHFWVLASEARCVITRNIDTLRPCRMRLKVLLQNGEETDMMSPCILPSLDTIVRISTNNTQYWPITIDFTGSGDQLATFRTHQTIHVRRRPLIEAYNMPFMFWFHREDVDELPLVDWKWISDFANSSDPTSVNNISILFEDDSSQGDLTNFSLDSRIASVDERLTLLQNVQASDRVKVANTSFVLEWAKYIREHGSGRSRWLDLDLINLLGATLHRGNRTVHSECR